MHITNFFNVKQISNGHIFSEINPLELLGYALPVWLEKFLNQLGVKNEPISKSHIPQNAYVTGRVFIDEDVTIEPNAMITGPAYIGKGSSIRHCAYIRPSVYVGTNCLIGHATEVNRSILFDGVKAAHFNYIGDSIVGQQTNIGAGAKIANTRFDRQEIYYRDPMTNEKKKSGLLKFGALVGDYSNIGCNAVLAPGSVLRPESIVKPCFFYK